MKKQNLKNRVIFVSRKYGGVRMGADRFECYLSAAKIVAKQHKWNIVLQQNQEIDENPPPVQSQDNQGNQKSKHASDKPQPQRPRRGGYYYQNSRTQNRRQLRPSESVRGARLSTQNAYRGRLSPRQEQLNSYRKWSAYRGGRDGSYQTDGAWSDRYQRDLDEYSTREDWESARDGSFYEHRKGYEH